MPLSAGTRLGPYEIQSPVGAGGMGEVYRARDTRLERTVALKVIAPAVAAAADLRERFEREARAVSQLNHPNICTLHDIGHDGGVDYLVLEYLDGEPLDQRLQAGPLPLEQAFPMAIQICDALDKAHRAGIVHRDLKPGNVFLVRGASASAPPVAKLLDFGLAKVLPAASGAGVSLTGTPTVTTPLTAQGTILGTFQYMAPEQLEGADADARTDIWAFGCVLYEMLTGRKAFAGRTHASLISSIMSAQPAALTELQPDAPAVLDRVIRTCLAKDPAERFQTAHDLLLQLRWMQSGGADAERPVVPPSRHGIRPMMFAAGVAGAVIIAAAATWWFTRAAPAVPPPVVRAIVELPTTQPFGLFGTRNLAISPDGTKVVFAAVDGDRPKLFVRPLDRFEPPARMTGTDEAFMPFFSPDGQWVGYFSAGKLRKIPLTGGASTVICDMTAPFGAAWAPDDTIIFANATTAVLMRVAASGGEPAPLTTLEQGETAHRWPAVLPDGSVLFAANMGGNWSEGRIVVHPVDGRPRRTVVQGGNAPQHVGSGHITFLRNGAVFAAGFDPKRLEVVGPPRQIADSVAALEDDGRAQYAVSRAGTLAYVSAIEGGVQRELMWVERDGRTHPLGVEPKAFDHPRISPDGRFVAITVRAENPDIWVLDLSRRTLSRVTDSPGEDESPVWTPDGKRITYASSPAGKPRTTYSKAPDGSGGEEEVITSKTHQHLSGWTPDGKMLVSEEIDPSFGIYVASPAEKSVKPFLQTRFTEVAAQVSPDGKWIAYVSNESGRPEVYVQSFPLPGSRMPISNDGGGEPRWAASGRELFYRAGDRMMAVPIEYTPLLRAGTPRVLFEGKFARIGWGQANYDVAPDGRRFLMIKGEEQALPTKIHLTLNWIRELETR